MATLSSPSLEELLSHYGFQKEVLDSVCPREVRDRIALKFEDWKMVGRCLKFPPEKLKAVDRENETEDQRRVALLDDWAKREGKGATYLKLAEVLHQRGRSDLIEMLCDQLKEIVVHQEHIMSKSTISDIGSSQAVMINTAERIEALESQFDSLHQQLMAEITENGALSGMELLRALTMLPISLRKEYESLIQQMLPTLDIKGTVTELFLRLGPLFRFIDYGLLNHLISKFGSAKLQEDMKLYTSKIQAFMRDTTVADLMDYWPGDEQPHLNYSKLRAKFSDDPKTYTLERLNNFRRKFCSKVRLSEFIFGLIVLETGKSFFATWLVPTVVASDLRKAINEMDESFYLMEQVVMISLDDDVLYTWSIVKQESETKEMQLSVITTPKVHAKELESPNNTTTDPATTSSNIYTQVHYSQNQFRSEMEDAMVPPKGSTTLKVPHIPSPNNLGGEIKPFSLAFNPVSSPASVQELEQQRLLQDLAVKQEELKQKEEEIERLKIALENANSDMGKFRKALLRISNKLRKKDFEYIKFLCEDDVPKSKMDHIISGIDLFNALEERGKISEKNLGFLVKILATIPRYDLIQFLREEGFMIPTQVTSPMTHNSQMFLFRECLIKIADRLHSENINALIFILQQELQVSRDTLSSTIELFKLMMQRQIITATNLKELHHALWAIDRYDLVRLIHDYLIATGQELYSAPSLYVQLNQDQTPVEKIEPAPMIHFNPDRGILRLPKRPPLSHRYTTESKTWSNNNDGIVLFGFGFDFNIYKSGEPVSSTPSKQKLEQLQVHLAMKERELVRKEEEIRWWTGRENLEATRTEIEHLEQHTRRLEKLLVTKNEEVTQLADEVQNFYRQMDPLSSAKATGENEFYRMDKIPHGICVIINNHKFYHLTDPEKALCNRSGAEIDQDNLKLTFEHLSYIVEIYDNLTHTQIKDVVLSMAQRNHANYDSFVCCILTHGEQNMIYGADSIPISLLDLSGALKICTTLINKPKMFFIQADHGDREEKNAELAVGEAIPLRSPQQPNVPLQTDFFFSYATRLSSAAYQSHHRGSWYISELCKVLKTHGYTSNLSNMMRRVNDGMCKAFAKEGCKQTAEFVDQLRKDVRFFYFQQRND